MSTFDFYAELATLMNPKSLYAKELEIDLEQYIISILDAFEVFFKQEQKQQFRSLIERELRKIYNNKSLEDTEKMNIIK